MSTQRGAILAATARTVARRGYEGTSIFEIAIEAHVQVRDVRRLFGDEEACFYALFSATFHEAFALVLERTRDVPWPQSARDGLATFLEFLAARPVHVRACLDGVRTLGQDGSLRLETAIEAFTAFLTPGFAANGGTPIFHGNLIGSTVVHVITQHVQENRIEELPAALPQLLGVALIPFCDARAIDALLIAG
ncbi:TetR/AcrR family transcriptional regulator [Baekduia sp.]|uniref:TetR/AcrR family transcriptional regulator n=1 Tax=Baekduia sp. TaxID=2600305 RepID=UPI002DFCDBB6|nr:TetR/AcrR family transcriptional regulator [Baekduia sp.]